MNREPSPHSMTVEVHVADADEVTNLLSAARSEIARLGALVDQLTAERDEAKRNLNGLLVAGFNTPPGECTNCAEMAEKLKNARATRIASRLECTDCAELRTTLDEARAALQAQTDLHRNALTELSTLRATDASRRSELAHLTKQLHEVAADRDRNIQQRNKLQHELSTCREDLAAADRTVRVTKAALDAAIEAV